MNSTMMTDHDRRNGEHFAEISPRCQSILLRLNRVWHLAAAFVVLLLLLSPASAATFRFASTSNRIYVEGGGSATLSDIKTVESHVHAIGQCRKAIRKLGVKPIVAADTAGSAREIAAAGDKSRAAIASRLAAEIYGLTILQEDIEDEAHNTTRFIVLARDAKWAPSGSGLVVTTFLFRVRNVPAALYKVLGGFATNGVNMTKLESYMIEGNFFATQFYADVEGHPEDRKLVLAFEELSFFSKEMKILGVYPAHKFRATFEEPAD